MEFVVSRSYLVKRLGPPFTPVNIYLPSLIHTTFPFQKYETKTRGRPWGVSTVHGVWTIYDKIFTVSSLKFRYLDRGGGNEKIPRFPINFGTRTKRLLLNRKTVRGKVYLNPRHSHVSRRNPTTTGPTLRWQRLEHPESHTHVVGPRRRHSLWRCVETDHETWTNYVSRLLRVQL